MKMKYMKPAAVLCVAFSCLLGATSFASEQNMKLTMTVGDVPADYTMTIPANTNIDNFGFTELADGLTISGTLPKKSYVEVSLKSDNDFKLTEKEDNTKSIAYAVYESEREEADKFTFEANELGTKKDVKVYVTQEDWNAVPPGEYSDVITFTAETKDKEALK
ncbi:MAG: hypothetical protein IJ583_01345 [Firmicutes bacterium]|nr:hypothetical protein [Bacillota bacterium]